jgi:hypothetical protein
MTTRIELDGRESLDMSVTRDEAETGEITLTLTTENGTVEITMGRTQDDAADLANQLYLAMEQAAGVRDNWHDIPDEGDGYITLDRGNYYVRLNTVPPEDQPEHGYPDEHVAMYELAKLMTERGDFPPAWAEGEHGPSVREINDEVRAFHDQSGSQLRPLPGVRYSHGAHVIADDWPSAVRADYGDMGVLLYPSGVPGEDTLFPHDQLTAIPED